MSTRAQILAEIAAQFPDNTTGLITPAKLRQVVEDVTNSCLVSDTDAGTAGIEALQAETQEQLRTAAGLAGLSTTGIVARTGAGTAATRTITGTANQIIVANGDGAAGNPTLSLPANIATTSAQFDLIGIGVGAVAGHTIIANNTDANRVLFSGTTKGIRFTHNSAGSAIEGVDNIGSASYQPLYLGGSVLAFTVSGSQKATINGNGFLGVGVASPSGILDVAKPSSGGRFQVVNEGADVYNVIASRNAADSAYLPLTVRTTGLVVGSPSEGVIQQIQAPGETRMFVTNTTDSVSCQVGASPSATYVGSYTSHPLELRTSDTPRVTIGTSGGVRFNDYGAGTLVTDSSGNVTASSDASLKTVTGSFTRGLADVLKLTPRTYHWKESSGMNTEDENVGFIAQEVLTAVPEAVGQFRTVEVEDKDGKKAKKREKAELLTLSDRPLIAALVNAVKELKAENDELRKRLDRLETKKGNTDPTHEESSTS